MSKKAPKEEIIEQPQVKRKLVVDFAIMNNTGVMPVAKPADFIYLTPVVQPIPIMPYTTQQQPLAQSDEEYDY